MEWRFYDDAAGLVRTNMDVMNDRVDAALTRVAGVLTALQNFDPTGGDQPQPPTMSLPAITVPPSTGVTAPSTPDFGVIGEVEDPELVDLSANLGLDASLVSLPGPFKPKTLIPSFPDAPDPISTSGQPIRPPVDTNLPIPDPPSYTDPIKPVFIALNIPGNPGITDTVFEGIRPVFTGVAPKAIFNWNEPTYNPQVLSTVESYLAAALAGGTGIPSVVQEAMWEAARAREDLTALAAVQQATDSWAGNGFGMPPGMLVRAVEIANEKAQFASNDLSRTILTEGRKWEIENIRFAVEKSLALEGMLHDWFEAAVKRIYEAQKYQLEMEVKLYDVAVALYNASQAAYQTDAIVFREIIQGKIARLTAWKTEIDGEIAKGQVNEQAVRLYLGEWDGIKAALSAFNTKMEGVAHKAGIARTILDGFATDVKAWDSLLTARKAPLEAYEIGNRGRVAQIGGFQAEATAFAETVRAAEAEGNLKIKFIDANIAAANASTQRYLARLQAQREKVQADLAKVQALATSYTADIGRFRAEIEGETTARGQEIQIEEMRLRNLIAFYETQLREFDAALARQIHRVELVLEGLKASGQFGTALASGAMSAIHVQAGISGEGRVSDSYGYSDNVSHTGGPRV